MRLQIQRGLFWAWRAPGRLQIGLDPDLGVILDGLTATDEQLLDALLDGSDVARLRSIARRLGAAEARVDVLVGTLRSAGVLVGRHTSSGTLRPLRSLSASGRQALRPLARTLALTYPGGDGWDVLAARRVASVAVAGAGATGLRLALGLAVAGVGQVLLRDDGRVRRDDVQPAGYAVDHVGRRREAAGAELLTAAVPHVRTSARSGFTPRLVVIVATGALDASRVDSLLREGVPHLAVLLRERDAVVGPVVRPGRTCCLRCIDLHRRDRDPEWPRVVPQLAGRAPAGEDPVLSSLAASLAVAQALTELDGRVDPSALGATLEVALPDGRTAARTWPPHHECGCSGLPRSAWGGGPAAAGRTR